MDTLAAAYAELGQFPEATAAARRAAQLARADGNSVRANEIESRTRLYQSKKPYRDHGD